jgi:hypothetical protein
MRSLIFDWWSIQINISSGVDHSRFALVRLLLMDGICNNIVALCCITIYRFLETYSANSVEKGLKFMIDHMQG